MKTRSLGNEAVDVRRIKTNSSNICYISRQVRSSRNYKMSRNSTEVAPKVQAKQLESAAPFEELEKNPELQSQHDQPKVMNPGSLKELHDISSPL